MGIQFKPFMQEGLDGLLNFIYPAACGLCSKKLDDKYQRSLLICKECLSKMKKNRPPFCKKCGRSLAGLVETLDTCRDCNQKKFYYERAHACYLYEGAVKEALHLFKYAKRQSLSKMFCGLFIESLIRDGYILKDIEGVIAVPLHGTKIRERGFNQSYMLAEAAARRFKIKEMSMHLKRISNTGPQSELDKNERRNNIKDAFRVQNDGSIKGKRLLLIDDVFTTGATLNECARVLKAAGAAQISCLTFSRGE